MRGNPRAYPRSPADHKSLPATATGAWGLALNDCAGLFAANRRRPRIA
jgi:hypothetical protein